MRREKEELIEVSAGKFKANAVAFESNWGTRTTKAVAWYAPDVRLVKSVSTINGNEATYVLKSFTTRK
jgi:hypothetical protein